MTSFHLPRKTFELIFSSNHSALSRLERGSGSLKWSYFEHSEMVSTPLVR